MVHLWVEGFFEVFATAAFAFIFYNMGFVRRSTATASTLAAAAIFMLGGIPGTLHHLYFSGSTSCLYGNRCMFLRFGSCTFDSAGS